MWSKVKALLRSAEARNPEHLVAAVGAASRHQPRAIPERRRLIPHAIRPARPAELAEAAPVGHLRLTCLGAFSQRSQSVIFFWNAEEQTSGESFSVGPERDLQLAGSAAHGFPEIAFQH